MEGAENEHGAPSSSGPAGGRQGQAAVVPDLLHRMTHGKSILALAVSASRIFAGTEGGEILVFDLGTYSPAGVIAGHGGSVLALCLSQDETLLFSSAGDRIVNVWRAAAPHARVYSVYSPYDVGDLFCAAYSSRAQTLYLGAQNTSIQWYDLRERDARPRPHPAAHPSFRDHRFFDSCGPGGVRAPRRRHAVGGQVLEIDRRHIRQFAHYGYVYCMVLARGVVADGDGDADADADADSEVLISGGGDGAIKVWRLDAADGGAVRELCTLEDGREAGEPVLSLALDGSFLYSGRLGGEVNVWDLETRQLLRNLRARTDDVLTLSVGGPFLFTAGVSGVVEVTCGFFLRFFFKFNRQYDSVTHFQAHKGRIMASAFATYNNHPIFVTGSNDGTVAIWDVKDCLSAPVAGGKTSNEQLTESLKHFISYRTVSSDERYKGDCRRGASYLRSVFKNFGAATEMLKTQEPCNPIIFAKFRGNPAKNTPRRRILFYGHYDVIAAENEQGRWISDPFTMEGINGYLYGRGVSDNKGPIMAAIYAVADLTASQSLDSDIVFLIEGEEECGSRGFYKAVREHKKLIGDVDWILLANSYWLDDHVPCLTYGLRGVIHATVQVSSAHPDLHSGVDGSALLDESLKDLVTLLSKLTGPHGRVELPGFYDAVLPLTPDEERLYADITRTLVARNPALGPADALAASLKRRWREASLTMHRIHTSGPDNSTIIPRLARAALSLRLVPNQDAAAVADALRRFLAAQFAALGSSNALDVSLDHVAEPWLGDTANDVFRTLERAVMAVWGPVMAARERRRSSLAAAASAGRGPAAARAPRRPSSGASEPARPDAPAAPPAAGAAAAAAVHPRGGLDTGDTVPGEGVRGAGGAPAVRAGERQRPPGQRAAAAAELVQEQGDF
ncbi:hypothetical protein BDY21DRAFT_401297 [Lineolata rhizophorae]|uniref:Peptidase M20 dimerisation domain-containing protein n=1 Tax=Lineolata rhizophorae TaxID=578093 RepID=A0A6A6NPS8_9PEZI|nr:hypothetical protein BDY21DRAFT_401297 [Lineolata rhizophorae]